MKDPEAPVEFAINGETVVPDGENYEVKDLGEGKRQLIIKKVKMSDMGNVVAKTPSNRGDEIIESKSQFKVPTALYDSTCALFFPLLFTWFSETQ